MEFKWFEDDDGIYRLYEANNASARADGIYYASLPEGVAKSNSDDAWKDKIIFHVEPNGANFGDDLLKDAFNQDVAPWGRVFQYSPRGADWTRSFQVNFTDGQPSVQWVSEEGLNGWEAANAANEQRYNQMINGFYVQNGQIVDAGTEGATYVPGLAQNYAEAQYQLNPQNEGTWAWNEAQQIGQNYENLYGAAAQDIADRGLTGTTIATNARQGNQNQYQQAMLNFQSNLATRRQSYADQLFGAIERRSDQVPLTYNLYNGGG